MNNLYTHRNSNIRRTASLFTAFFILVIGLGWIFSQIYGSPEILYIAVIFSTAMSLVSYWYSDKIVLSMAHAKPVTKENYPELYAIVEKLSLAADLPMPKIYIVNERAPNAFATGRNSKNSAVAVTSGLLERLNRVELEGVLAHELSHIGNRDILISTIAVILAGFISLLSDLFLRSFFWGGYRKQRDNQAGSILFLIGIILAILAPISAMLIRLAISRKREFLADASGALLTAYPEGLASALEKIAEDPTPLRVAKNTTSHLWFDDPFTHGIGTGKKVFWLHRLFMSHPPAEERIRVLRNKKDKSI